MILHEVHDPGSLRKKFVGETQIRRKKFNHNKQGAASTPPPACFRLHLALDATPMRNRAIRRSGYRRDPDIRGRAYGPVSFDQPLGRNAIAPRLR